ncbi:MAG: TRAP transporter substrate-binding protein DctP [Gammaproteobacteria bacterium]
MLGRRAACFGRWWVGFALAALCAGTATAADIKLASVAPDGSRWIGQMRAGAEEVRMRTGGRVTFKFYPGGVMGNDAQVLRKIRAGQLHGGAFTSGGLAERYSGMSIYGIPLLFHSQEEVDAVRAKIDPLMAAGLDKAGFVSFGFTEGGFANLLSNEPIHSVEEMKRKKVWVPEGDQMSFLAMQTMGLSPVVLPVTDVLTGLQTGLIEITFASPVTALVLQWHTKVKYITVLPLSYSMGIFAIEKSTFSALMPADQQIVREVMGRYLGKLDREARDDNRKALEVLAKSGIQTVTVNSTDVEGWRQTIESLYPKLRTRSDVDVPLLDQLLTVLTDYRRAHPEPAH